MKILHMVAALSLSSAALFGCASPTVEFEPPKPTLRLVEIKAIQTTIGSSEDQIYFQFSDGTRYPAESQTIIKGQTWKPSIVLDATKAGSVKLYEDDAISDDLIGTFNYNQSQEGTYRQTMTGDGSRYDLIWVIRVE